MENRETMNRERMGAEGREPRESGLRLLSQMDDFKIASGNPDVRGWEVVARDGREIGKIDHLVVDPASREVRYLGVDLNDGLARKGSQGDHLLVPIEGARLGHDGRDDEKVFLNQNSREIGAFPLYDERSIRKLLDHLGDSSSGPDRREAPGRVLVIEEILIPLSRERSDERSH